jgi:hypothetical protein
MRTLTVLHKLTFAEYINSEYPNRIATNFGYEHLVDREHKRWFKYTPTVFICEANPETNYGLNFMTFLHYQTEDIKIIKEISYGSHSLRGGALEEVVGLPLLDLSLEQLAAILDSTPALEIDKLLWTGRCYRNNKEGRAFIASNKLTVS